MSLNIWKIVIAPGVLRPGLICSQSAWLSYWCCCSAGRRPTRIVGGRTSLAWGQVVDQRSEEYFKHLNNWGNFQKKIKNYIILHFLKNPKKLNCDNTVTQLAQNTSQTPLHPLSTFLKDEISLQWRDSERRKSSHSQRAPITTPNQTWSLKWCFNKMDKCFSPPQHMSFAGKGVSKMLISLVWPNKFEASEQNDWNTTKQFLITPSAFTHPSCQIVVIPDSGERSMKILNFDCHFGKFGGGGITHNAD